MRKWIIASLGAAAITGLGVSPFALAAPDASPAGAEMPHRGPSPEIMAALLDAKLAGMKAALKLTPDQEKAWAPFESAVRDAAKARMDAMRAMRELHKEGEKMTPIERMNAMSDHLAKAAAELKQVADAAKPLYDSLDDQQKAEFGPLLMTLRPHPWHHGGPGGEEHRPGGWMQP